MENKYTVKIVALLSIALLVILSFIDPIPQDTSYHNFADKRQLCGVNHFWNVLSNLPFLLVGVWALDKMFIVKSIVYDKSMHIGFVLFVLGISLVSFGSGYYHLNPTNETLIWDRLPMGIAFMALFSIIISEFISLKEGKRLLYPLIFLGLFSVLYWAYTQSQDQGDLRLYVFVQFFPVIAIPVLLIQFKSTFTLPQGYWYLLICYVAAKVFEHYDKAIYEFLGFISGHSLKHMIAALGLYLLVKTYLNRTRIEI